jgi:hypothetical protein
MSHRKGDHDSMVKADGSQAALGGQRHRAGASHTRGDGSSQRPTRDGRPQRSPRPSGVHRPPQEGTMNGHQIRELLAQPDGAHVAVCLCGWRSGPLESDDDAAAAGLLHQLRML